MKKHVQEITKDDLPVGVPALKWKRGLYYRPNNCGYTDSLIFAGLYDRDEVIQYCFDGDKNGSCDVYAMPLWMAMRQQYWDRKKIRAVQDRMELLAKHATEDDYDTVIF